MSLFDFVPDDFEPIQMRPNFLVWLQHQPITFHQRLHIYFRWLDYHSTDYTSDEIHSLNIAEPIFEPE